MFRPAMNLRAEPELRSFRERSSSRGDAEGAERFLEITERHSVVLSPFQSFLWNFRFRAEESRLKPRLPSRPVSEPAPARGAASKRVWIFLAATLMAAVSRAADTGPEPVSLRKCVARALAHNFQIRLSELDRRNAEDDFEAARAIFDPVFALGGSRNATRSAAATTQLDGRLNKQ